MSGWSLDGVTVQYRGAARPALEGISVDLRAGEWAAVIGPNGAGKSSLVHAAIGTAPVTVGTVRFGGRPLRNWGGRALARAVGVVLQIEELPAALTVREVVAMGRYPHLGPWQREGPADRRAIDEALATCDVAELAGRPIGSLSGGERQRARIARALAQQPEALVLDEPTAGLDLGHEMALFELLRGLARANVTVLLVTHHVNLAARYASVLVLMDGGRIRATGRPAAVLTADVTSAIYGWSVAIGRHPGPGPDSGAPQLIPLADSAPKPTATRGAGTDAA